MEEDENMTALVYRMDDTLKEYRNDVMDIGGDFTNEDCTGTSWSWASKFHLRMFDPNLPGQLPLTLHGFGLRLFSLCFQTRFCFP